MNYTIYAKMHPNGSYTWDTAYCQPQYIYDDSNRVYLYDNLYNSFYLLYDFNAAAGDTITVRDSIFFGLCDNTFPFNLFQYKINSINDTLICGINLKVQNVTSTQNSEWYITNMYNLQGYYPIILEKIGSFKFLFGVGSFLEGDVSYIRCYEDSSMSYRAPNYPISLPCDYLYTLPTDIKKKEKKDAISVFPNPANDFIRFIFSETTLVKPISIAVFDVFGQKVKFETFSELGNEFKMCTLNLKGTYLYSIMDATEKILGTGVFIVKH